MFAHYIFIRLHNYLYDKIISLTKTCFSALFSILLQPSFFSIWIRSQPDCWHSRQHQTSDQPRATDLRHCLCCCSIGIPRHRWRLKCLHRCCYYHRDIRWTTPHRNRVTSHSTTIYRLTALCRHVFRDFDDGDGGCRCCFLALPVNASNANSSHSRRHIRPGSSIPTTAPLSSRELAQIPNLDHCQLVPLVVCGNVLHPVETKCDNKKSTRTVHDDDDGWCTTWQLPITPLLQRSTSTNPTTRHSIFSVVIGGFFYWTSLFCTNQASVQKCMSLKSMKKAKTAICFAILGKLPLSGAIAAEIKYRAAALILKTGCNTCTQKIIRWSLIEWRKLFACEQFQAK